MPGDAPGRVEVVVEVPRGAHAKRGPDGRLDFLSPLPCPFNYGSVPGTVAADGEPEDAVVLGPPLPRGARVALRVVGRVRFEDGGVADDKWVCAEAPPGPAERRRVERFFARYARAKRLAHRLGLRRGGARLLGVEWVRPA